MFELLWVDEIDDPVAITEAVELARTLSTDDSPRFLNGVLEPDRRSLPSTCAPPADAQGDQPHSRTSSIRFDERSTVDGVRLAIFLGAFAIGLTEFAIMGLLPQVATDLAVSVPTAGNLVTAYAIGRDRRRAAAGARSVAPRRCSVAFMTPVRGGERPEVCPVDQRCNVASR